MAGIGSGLGGYFAVGEGAGTYAGTAGYQTPTRTIPVKSAKPTWNPHIVQGGPYVRGTSSANIVDVGSANVATYLDATVAVATDFFNTGMALLIAQLFGTAATLTEIGTQSAYQLVTGPFSAQDGKWIDAQIGVPDTGGTVHAQSYHSGKITKAEFVIPRDGIATATYDLDFAYVEFATAAIVPSQPLAPIPFSMNSAASQFQVWNGTAMATLDGCRQATITFTPKLDTTRIYLGNVYKDEPVTNGLVEIAVALEMDYTPTAASDIFSLFIPHTSLGNGTQADATVITAVSGPPIGTSTQSATLQFSFPQLIIQTGGEAPLDGVDIVKNTINLKATLDEAGDGAAYCTLVTPDTTF